MGFTRPEIIRPPSERRSLYLPLTRGCSNNTCTFCSWNGSKLALREPGEVKQEIDALALFMKSGMYVSGIPSIVYHLAGHWDGRRVFLQDGDALVYPHQPLEEILAYLSQKLPQIKRIACYATAADVLRLTPKQLKDLASLKLNIFYIGVESGDDDVLQRVCKGATAEQFVAAGHRAREAGITVSVSLILGLGGVQDSEKHALATARLLTWMDPDFTGALTLTLVPGTPLFNACERGEFVPVTPFQSLTELKTIVENTEMTRCFFSSTHASNYFTVRGIFPQDKTKMVRDLEGILSSNDPGLLRPEYLRGL